MTYYMRTTKDDSEQVVSRGKVLKAEDVEKLLIR